MFVRLTFDDGPGPSTPDLLDVLRDAACKATFFLLGRNLESGWRVAVRMAREGHVLGNHTYSHARAAALPDDELAAEIAATDALIRRVYQDAGLQPPSSLPLRLPYGVQPDDPRLRVLQGLGRESVGWTMILDDSQRPQPAPDALLASIERHVEESRRAGQDVVLCMHDSSRHREARPATVETVRRLSGDPRLRILLD